VRAAEVVSRAHPDDPVAREALDRFAVWLGRFAGDAAPFFGARGGVYIGGGIARSTPSPPAPSARHARRKGG
jgi:glucokinase